jgi:hypothetical protein
MTRICLSIEDILFAVNLDKEQMAESSWQLAAGRERDGIQLAAGSWQLAAY